MIDLIWFVSCMQGIVLVFEFLWWLMGVIVSFYFGVWYQVKSQDFQDFVVCIVFVVVGVVDWQKQLEICVVFVEINFVFDVWRVDND